MQEDCEISSVKELCGAVAHTRGPELRFGGIGSHSRMSFASPAWPARPDCALGTNVPYPAIDAACWRRRTARGSAVREVSDLVFQWRGKYK